MESSPFATNSGVRTCRDGAQKLAKVRSPGMAHRDISASNGASDKGSVSMWQYSRLTASRQNGTRSRTGKPAVEN
jgi:hypothetical protein